MQQSVALNSTIPLIYLSIHGKIMPDFAWRHAAMMNDKVSSGPVVTHSGESAGTGTLILNVGDEPPLEQDYGAAPSR